MSSGSGSKEVFDHEAVLPDTSGRDAREERGYERHGEHGEERLRQQPVAVRAPRDGW